MPLPSVDHEAQLQQAIAGFADDPLSFVRFAYPWGEKGTILEDETGPDPWQEKILTDIRDGIQQGFVINNGRRVQCRRDDGTIAIFIAVGSGHGIGKSALMAMLDQWFISTKPHPQIVTTANTREQLESKTWREQAKWHNLLINKHWFEWSATRFACLADPTTWFGKAIPWSEKNPEAFAGTHERFVLFKFDEASAIPDAIWETSEGAFTDIGGIKIHIVFGNPTRNTGRFAECFRKQRHRWITYSIDSRTSNRTDKVLIQDWADTYGEDSDFFRVRVKGEFPRIGATQLISPETVEEAMKDEHPYEVFAHAPKILGVDPARFGDDKTVFVRRQGLQAYGLKKYSGLDLMKTASLVAQEIELDRPDGVFIDETGIGAGVVDRLHQLGYSIVTGVNFGASATDDKRYANTRTEIWCTMAEWVKRGKIPRDNDLRDDLTGPEYGFDVRERRILESKKDMKKRGMASPDCGDALALTFTQPVETTDDRVERLLRANTQAKLNPFERNRGRFNCGHDRASSAPTRDYKGGIRW